ncbi:glycosyltransferase family 4 protein [Spirulina major]|uniref:glycosyltransferase family 4 protein n=1 Tax=Spirulina major TaxID=270636 RepID=UPI0009348990|nr:glycosyltransferase family 4 protein [Spirulina major]
MKILIYSPQFSPSVGGVEAVAEMLATEWTALGDSVTVLCHTPDPAARSYPFTVVRQPSAIQLWRLVGEADWVVHICVSLKGLGPILLLGKPWAISHQTWYRRPNGRTAWQDHLKRFATRFAAVNIAASQAIAAHLPSPAIVIGNPYADDIFQIDPTARRDRDLIFVGRFVSDKGVDLLLDALADLAPAGLFPQLTLVGSGPDRAALAAQGERLGLSDRLTFTGPLPPAAVAAHLNRHRILVVPSRWPEPFGIVALEGLACGCVVVGSEDGGLKDAIGPGGVTVPNGDRAALATALTTLLTHPDPWTHYHPHIPPHLHAHQRHTVARRYLKALQSIKS